MIDLSGPPDVMACGVGGPGIARPVEIFRLPQLWQFHLYDYVADLIIDGALVSIRPGTVTLAPPGAVTEFRYRGPSRHLFAHLRATQVGEQAPLVVHLGRELAAIHDLVESAVANASRRPEQTQAAFWLALLRLADLGGGPDSGTAVDHVARALGVIETRLGEALTVAEIAAEVGISHNHLTRLVRAHTGRTVVGYLRHRRIERAEHLLTRTTMSISAIAAMVGFGDLQAFNKACRAETGQSPRALRGDTRS